MSYRPDIDGLRAVAVISVILFHLNSSWLPGGFLGVDIFFVISGYLIGGILFRELSTNTFSLKNFYLRRMRRILPAFFAVVIFVLVVGGQLMMPGSDEWNLTRRSALSSVFFSGNIYFARNMDYFVPAVEIQSLNHLWSLGVEEQFYFLYPLILLMIMFVVRSASKQGAKLNTPVIWMLVLLAVLSFSGAFFPTSYHDTEFVAYYLPHLRFGELLIGAILAVAVSNATKEISSTRATVVGSLGLLVLVVCLTISFPNKTPWFPGFAAAIPCIASAGIIYAGFGNHWVKKLLSNRVMVFVGKISYSLYLWHWPLLAFAHYLLGKKLAPQVVVIVVILTLLFSLASYYLIEQPLRHRQWKFARTGLVYYVLPVFVVVTLYLPKRKMPAAMEPFVSCGVLRGTEMVLTYSTIGMQNQTPNVLIVGNSYTMQLRNFFDNVAKAEGWCGVLSGVSGAFPHNLEKQKAISTEEFQQLYNDISLSGYWSEKLNNLRSRKIISDLPKFNTIIISLNWWYPGTYSKVLPEVLSTIGFLQKQGKKIILVNSCFTYNTYRIAETYHKVMGKGNLLAQILPEPILRNEEYAKAEQEFAKVKQKIDSCFPQVRWINLLPMLPADLMVDGKSVLCNERHINIMGANYLADQFIKSGQRILPQQDSTKVLR